MSLNVVQFDENNSLVNVLPTNKNFREINQILNVFTRNWIKNIMNTIASHNPFRNMISYLIILLYLMYF